MAKATAIKLCLSEPVPLYDARQLLPVYTDARSPQGTPAASLPPAQPCRGDPAAALTANSRADRTALCGTTNGTGIPPSQLSDWPRSAGDYFLHGLPQQRTGKLVQPYATRRSQAHYSAARSEVSSACWGSPTAGSPASVITLTLGILGGFCSPRPSVACRRYPAGRSALRSAGAARRRPAA